MEFSDLQCPYSKKTMSLVKDLLAAFPNDLKHVYKHFPLSFHKQAEPAARACIAAGMQGKFWEMQEMAYENAKKLSDDNLKKYAEKIAPPPDCTALIEKLQYETIIRIHSRSIKDKYIAKGAIIKGVANKFELAAWKLKPQ